MIHYEEFYDAMKELSDLTGSRITSDTVKALHRVLNSVDINDFRKAVIAVAESGEKPNLFSLRKQVNIAMTIRLEREAAIRKRQEEEDIKRFWLAHFKEGECVRHECGQCPKQFCHIVSNECIRQMRAMLSGDKDVEQAHSELAEQFSDIGFEQYCGVEPF